MFKNWFSRGDKAEVPGDAAVSPSAASGGCGCMAGSCGGFCDPYKVGYEEGVAVTLRAIRGTIIVVDKKDVAAFEDAFDVWETNRITIMTPAEAKRANLSAILKRNS